MHPSFDEALLALVIGMGGVMAFLTVLTLVTAMITRVWREPGAPGPGPAGGGAGRAPKPPALSPAPAVPPAGEGEVAPRAPEASPSPEGEAVAAAVAVALHLRGLSSGPGPEVAAAIATALALHRSLTAVPAPESGSRGSPWRLAGSLESMGGRSPRRGRAASR
ncbi:MAG: OadG family protein [Deferrisomatales bacterium]|nr:OadG family protein [Deferrisomatales bacterium]